MVIIMIQNENPSLDEFTDSQRTWNAPHNLSMSLIIELQKAETYC